MHDNLAPSGWYPDPTNNGRLRYWDGTRWTDQFAGQEPAASETHGVRLQPSGSDTTSVSRPRRRIGLVLSSVIGWCLAVVLGVTALTLLATVQADASGTASQNKNGLRELCNRLSDDPTLLDDWRHAIDFDDSVTVELVSLRATEPLVRELANELRPLGLRLFALAGTKSFEAGESPDLWNHREVLSAALYSVRAVDAIDTWDFTDTRYRILQAKMSGSFSFDSTDLGYASVPDSIGKTCG